MKHTFAALVAFAIALPAFAADSPQRTETLSTPGGPVTTSTTTIDPVPQQVTAASVAELDMEWVVVTDQYGTDYGVRSRRVEVLAYPFASVEKRIDRSEHGFMVAVFHAIDQSIAAR